MTSIPTRDERPLFICGTSRSGTTVLAACFRKQSEFSIAPETHYFDDLRVRLGNRIDKKLDEGEKKLCEDYFLALTHRPYGYKGEPDKGWMQRSALRKAAETLGGSPDDFFAAFCQLNMQRKARSRWGEKTPRHAFRIDDIIEAFPAAKIVYMLRDPRGVVASYRDWHGNKEHKQDTQSEYSIADQEEIQRTKNSYDPIIITLLWKGAFRAAISAKKKHGAEHVKIVHYESLCKNPDDVLRDIFQWVGSINKPDSSKVAVQNSSYTESGAKRGIDASSMDRWKMLLSDREIALIELAAGECLSESGYESAAPNVSTMRLASDLAKTAPALARALLANASRSGNIFKYAIRRARLIMSSK